MPKLRTSGHRQRPLRLRGARGVKVALSGETSVCAALTLGLPGRGYLPAGTDLPDLLVWCAPGSQSEVVSSVLFSQVAESWADYARRCGPPVGDNSGEKRVQGAVLMLCDQGSGAALSVLSGQLAALSLRFAPNLRVNLLVGDYASPEGFLRPAFDWLACSPVVTGQILGSKRV